VRRARFGDQSGKSVGTTCRVRLGQCRIAPDGGRCADIADRQTTGYGDIVPVDPFARSLANLEPVLGQFFLAITVTRLVTMELEDRRRRE